MAGSPTDIIYEKGDGIAWIRINRPKVYNAFRPRTIDELLAAFTDAWNDDEVGVAVLTGTKGNFCTGGDQKLRGEGGYADEKGATTRLQVLHLQRMIREIP
ncbi:MAG: 1,4-dihydroxy-2-naphthoyl-CoA synthase, partial [Dehalococcoidia bacterium]|nr:1,4-dihydroxy-2-naphthoyl-CoA synthase [Dehalococcoidia bacterium]